MTDEQKILLTVVIAMGIAAMIFLIYKWIRKTFYEYNECTGQIELKSKIWAESEGEQSTDATVGEELVHVRVINKSMTPATEMTKAYYYINFYDTTYGDQFIMTVDRDTYEATSIDHSGRLYYRYNKNKGYTFCRFEPSAEMFNEGK